MLTSAIISMRTGWGKPRHFGREKADYVKDADKNVMHGQNLKIRLSKTRTGSELCSTQVPVSEGWNLRSYLSCPTCGRRFSSSSKNDVLPRDAIIANSSESVEASSTGPDAVNGPALQVFLQIYSSYADNTCIGSNAGGEGVYAVGPTFLNFDVTLPAQHAMPNTWLPDDVLVKPATEPPLSLLILVHPRLGSWDIVLRPAEGKIGADYKSLPPAVQYKVSVAFSRRWKRMPNTELKDTEWGKGLKRVDFLRGTIRFAGVSKSQLGYNYLNLLLTPKPGPKRYRCQLIEVDCRARNTALAITELEELEKSRTDRDDGQANFIEGNVVGLLFASSERMTEVGLVHYEAPNLSRVWHRTYIVKTGNVPEWSSFLREKLIYTSSTNWPPAQGGVVDTAK
ncbi:hypothetical protein DFH08DRAFT_804328 [Mycena albidolilacea]|uniref:DUF6699 domain-containing protein n=1 Tax=Mycena albidolilacea TaxID=1033008 RepID=A0AAD7EW64_9AGAR|nr:hypothetical protein DFH08DRAFT_804328 [Mycena albidolilacea]